MKDTEDERGKVLCKKTKKVSTNCKRIFGEKRNKIQTSHIIFELPTRRKSGKKRERNPKRAIKLIENEA